VNVLLITLTQAVDIEYGGQATTIKFGRIFFKFCLIGFATCVAGSIILWGDFSLTAWPPEKTFCYFTAVSTFSTFSVLSTLSTLTYFGACSTTFF
jgi:hypothetical protein